MNAVRGYATVSFGQVHYRFAGTPGKPVLVLLHQTPSTSAMYEDLMTALAADYRMFAPDTPGMGMSDAPEGDLSIARLAAGLSEFLDEVGIERCFLFGHHTGAAIAAELAAMHANRFDAVALSGPTLLSENLKVRLPEMSSAFAVREDGSHLSDMWMRIRDKDRNAPTSISMRETLNGIMLGEDYPAAYDAVIDHDMAAALTSLGCPALVFAGTDDVLHGQLDAAMNLLSQGRKHEVAGAKTFVCETHCAEVAGLLRDFFGTEAA
ncbi:MAG: alpha/beta hydrolase [Gammaproteobacteria bacterium]|nr:alpha/beta hydrolase [Gammaproteobacteria bacterium]MDH3759200.1 alpha/beta hydrolase [Gammaproteobacteria bacterium]